MALYLFATATAEASVPTVNSIVNIPDISGILAVGHTNGIPTVISHTTHTRCNKVEFGQIIDVSPARGSDGSLNEWSKSCSMMSSSASSATLLSG